MAMTPPWVVSPARPSTHAPSARFARYGRYETLVRSAQHRPREEPLVTAETGTADGVQSDAVLIAATRTGDQAAAGLLYDRHAGAARVVARQYTNSDADADDVVADAFAAVYGALSRGNGPEEAFRAYLFTVVRRVAAVHRDRARRVEPTDDVATLEAGTALAGTADEPALAGFERGVVARAFHSLPERWQAVLWHTEVEGLTPAQIAPILGMSANSVAALSYRAREGLRQAYLQQHLQDPLDAGCRTVAGKLGAYVRGGLGARDTAQVEAHLETCGECRALVLELGDVNHGMRAIIAPLVLGLVGAGALTGGLLPVGGGLAAAGAAAGAANAPVPGGAEAAAGGTAAAGAAGAGAVAAGAGAGAGTSGAAAGGLAAFLATIPTGAVAAVAGAVVVAAVAAAVVIGLKATRDDDLEAAPLVSPTTSASPGPSPTDPGAGTTPSVVPTPAPSESVLLPEPAPGVSPTVPAPVVDVPKAPEPTTPAPEPTPEPTPEPSPTTEPTPPPAPADVAVVIPDGGLVLAAGAAGQELAFGLRNSGGTTATDLVAVVEMPEGVTLDQVEGIAPGLGTASAGGGFVVNRALGGPAAGSGFTAMAAPQADGWTCRGVGTSTAQCELATLEPGVTARVVLTVSVDESFDGTDGAVSLHVTGGGVDVRPPPIPVRITPSPARLTLRTMPDRLVLVAGRTRQLVLDLANAGGSAATTGTTSATITLPGGVTWAVADGSAPWACAGEGTVVVCDLAELGSRASARLLLDLGALAPEDVVGRSVGLVLRPGSTPATYNLPLDVVRPATLEVRSEAATVALAAGRTTAVTVDVVDVGDLDARDVRVTATVPKGAVLVGDPSDGTWTCTTDGALECVTGALPAGGSLPLTLGLTSVPGLVGPIGDLVVSATAFDADTTDPLVVALTGRAPVLSVLAPPVTLQADDRGQLSFGVRVVGGEDAADAADVRATLTLPRNLEPDTEGWPEACTAERADDRWTVTCAFGLVRAGDVAEVLLPVRSLWSDAGTVSVVATAAGGASATGTASVPGRSGGLAQRFVTDGVGWNVTHVGAPLLSCSQLDQACASALTNGDRDNNGLAMLPLDEAAPQGPRASVPVSSSTSLGIPDGRTVAFAGLYWSANAGPKDGWSAGLGTAQLRGPTGGYRTVTSAEPPTLRTDNAGRRYYTSFADVTDLVASLGSGRWSLADVAVADGRTDTDPTYYAGWALVVVYSSPGDAAVTVYDGGTWVGTSDPPPVFRFASPEGTTAQLGVVAWEGDRTVTGDQLRLGGLCTSDTTALQPRRWNGTAGSSSNAFDSTATGWRAPNSLGVDAKPFSSVKVGCGVSSLAASTTGDQYLVGVVTLRAPVPIS